MLHSEFYVDKIFSLISAAIEKIFEQN